MGAQQSGSTSQGTGAQQPGGSSQASVPSGPSAQASEPQRAHAGTERTPGVASGVPVQAQSLHHQQQGQSQAGSSSVGPQQSKVEAQPQGSSHSNQVKPSGSVQSAGAGGPTALRWISTREVLVMQHFELLIS